MRKTITAAVVVAALTGCEIDYYEKGEGEMSLVTAEMGMAHCDGERQVDYMLTDGGLRLAMAPGLTADWMTTGDSTYRVLLYYKRTGEEQAEAVNMSRVGVMTPHALTEGKNGEAAPQMKSDPLHWESAWVSADGRWLNLRLRLMTGRSDDEKALQTLGLVPDTVQRAKRHQHLRLYHDQGGQPQHYSTVAYASMAIDADSTDSITLTVNTYEGEVTRSFATTRYRFFTRRARQASPSDDAP